MTVASLDYRQTFFEDVVASKLGYNPRIEIKPAHLANGFFRAICGGYVNNEAQHMAIYPKFYPVLDQDQLPPDSKLQSKFLKFSPSQLEALRFLNGREQERAMLYALLGADRTLYKLVNTSSYSLSHVSHITNDNHDREAGPWLYTILKQGEHHPALDLIDELLQQKPEDRNDEISLLTLPLDNPGLKPRPSSRLYREPENTAVGSDGLFQNRIVRTIRAAFDQLANNDQDSARKNGKLDALRHFVTLGCFSVYLHLANAGSDSPLVPMVFRFDHTCQTLRQASIRSYEKMLISIDEFMYREIYAVLESLAKNGSYGPWDSDSAIEQHIQDTISWYRRKSQVGRDKEQSDVNKLQQDCVNFYRSYRGAPAGNTPLQALARALRDMLELVLSSTPQDVTRGLGTRIGLLNQSVRQKKTYDPRPDFLEVLVRASVPKNSSWTLSDLARHWADSFGILCGALGDENDRLRGLGIAVDQEEWLTNAGALAEVLELSGYARRYADGVVLVTVEQ